MQLDDNKTKALLGSAGEEADSNATSRCSRQQKDQDPLFDIPTW
jgi:hypothetical protein